MDHQTEMVTQGYLLEIIRTTPSLQLKVYLPNYQMTQYIVLIHYQLMDLYQIETLLEGKGICITEKLTQKKRIYHQNSQLMLRITPIINAENFHKKLRIYVINDDVPCKNLET